MFCKENLDVLIRLARFDLIGVLFSYGVDEILNAALDSLFNYEALIFRIEHCKF